MEAVADHVIELGRVVPVALLKKRTQITTLRSVSAAANVIFIKDDRILPPDRRLTKTIDFLFKHSTELKDRKGKKSGHEKNTRKVNSVALIDKFRANRLQKVFEDSSV